MASVNEDLDRPSVSHDSSLFTFGRTEPTSLQQNLITLSHIRNMWHEEMTQKTPSDLMARLKKTHNKASSCAVLFLFQLYMPC